MMVGGLLLRPLFGFGGGRASGNEVASPSTTGQTAPDDQGSGTDSASASPERALPEVVAVSTEHAVTIDGRELRYTATVGALPIRDEMGKMDARIFFTAYTAGAADGGARPLMFSFNGGPGSSSAWLHLGGLGPRRVAMPPDGAMPPPPFRLAENPHAWLAATDLVFVDPVETGYSRARTAELTKSFTSVEGDIAAFGEFVRLYLSRYGRWADPLFLVGESYGTFRAAGLAGYLIERGIACNGIVLVSSILDFLGADFRPGNDLPYPLILPTYAAIAWYHGKLAPELQNRPLADVVREAETWAIGDYFSGLARGAALSREERTELAARLARYTGLTEDYVQQHDLRVEIEHFRHELLRADGLIVGRLDGRFAAYAAPGVNEIPEFDPSLSAIRPPFTATLNHYLRHDLGYATDEEYHVLRGIDWGWRKTEEGLPTPPTTAPALATALTQNPYLRLFVASGHYDLATPAFATDYTLNHLPISAAARSGIRVEHYPVGHMVYLEEGSLARLRTDVTDFISSALDQAARPLPE